jgi:hypothetical protein
LSGIESGADRENLADLQDVIEALKEAEQALEAVIDGVGRGEREKFVFKVGFARGRLSLVTDRIYRGPETPNDDSTLPVQPQPRGAAR